MFGLLGIVAIHLGEALRPGGVPARQIGIEARHVGGRRPALVQHLEQLLAVDGLVHGLPHLLVGPRHLGVESSRYAPVLGVALRGLVLGAEVQSAESNDGLLRHLPATDEFESFGDRLVGEVSVDLGEVAFSRQQLGKARRLLDVPGHHDLFPVHHPPLPVRRRGALVQDIPAELPLLEDVRPGRAIRFPTGPVVPGQIRRRDLPNPLDHIRRPAGVAGRCHERARPGREDRCDPRERGRPAEVTPGPGPQRD